MQMFGRAASFLAMLGLACGAAWAGSPVQVSGAWARATAPGQDAGAVYMSISSPGGDRLTGVESPDATMATLHQSTRHDGVSGMMDMDALLLPAGQIVALGPHGMHVMLMGLKHPLLPGGYVELKLIFERVGRVYERVPVIGIGADAPRG